MPVNKCMNIAFCVNNGYVKNLAVVMFSILKNHPDVAVSFYIFSSDFSKENKTYLEKLKAFKDFSLKIVAVDKSEFSSCPITIDYISRETYFRFKIADWLPKVDKSLYMDADTVVNGNILPFYNLDLKNDYLAGTWDLLNKEKGYYKDFGLSAYVNAGVLLMNLKKMRADHLGDLFIKKASELKNKIRFQDQDILNIVCAGKIKVVDSIYNFTSRNMRREKSKRKQACIIHYTGKNKPWLKKRTHLKKVWQKYNKEALRFLEPRKGFWAKMFRRK